MSWPHYSYSNKIQVLWVLDKLMFQFVVIHIYTADCGMDIIQMKGLHFATLPLTVQILMSKFLHLQIPPPSCKGHDEVVTSDI